MFRILSFFSFIGTTLSQFRPPVLTIAPVQTVPVFTIGPIAPIRTIGTTVQNITTLTTQTTISTQTGEPENDQNFDFNLFLIIIPSGLLLILLSYFCLRKKKKNVVNIDLNIENNIPKQELERTSSNLSNHFYEEIDYEARYEMPDRQNVKYENINEENEYGKQVTTIV